MRTRATDIGGQKSEARKGWDEFFYNQTGSLKRTLCFAASLLISSLSYGSFEPAPIGARAAGMAEAYTMVSDDALALYYNPAGLVHIRRPEVGTYHGKLFMGVDDNSEVTRSFVGFVEPLKKPRWGAVGISYQQLSLTGLYTESAIGLSYGKAMRKNWNMGMTLKMLTVNYGSDAYTDNAINVDTGYSRGDRDPVFEGQRSKSALGLDLGTQYRLNQNYAVGAALRNVNKPKLGLEDKSEEAPFIYTVGLGRWTRVSAVSLEIMGREFVGGQDMRTSFGGERWFMSGFGLRAGLGMGSRGYRNVSAGGSFRMDGFQVDYAVQYPLQGIEKTAGSHMVSLTFRFGKPKPDPLEVTLTAERDARIRMEAEMLKLRAQLLELTSERPATGSRREAPIMDTQTKDALLEAQREIERLKSQTTVPAAPNAPVETTPPPLPAGMAMPPAPKAAAVRAPATPVRPTDQQVLAQYSDALRFYTNQVKNGVDVEERKDTLKRILEKFGNTALDLTAVRTELQKLESQNTKVAQDYTMSVSYYRRIVQQGTSNEERVILLERIIKKFKPLGVNTGELEKELEILKKSR
jgi:hypothetical protein